MADKFPYNRKKRLFKKAEQTELSIDLLASAIQSGDRKSLAQGITLVESKAVHHRKKASQLVQQLLPGTGNSIRIGITGVPGAGKSTWIETFGLKLAEEGHKIAVLAIDPSSSLSGGSILGDKTRMEELSHHANVFIRPTPTAGTLGGVHRMTRETMLLCEASGYDVILIETVGVGQSESMVRGMVDFFLLLALTGGGDELQGMKKGILELVDAILINKADGDNISKAKKAKSEYRQLLHFLQPATKGWTTSAYTCSAHTGEGIEEAWMLIKTFVQKTKENGVFDSRRSSQALDWMNQMVIDRLFDDFMHHPGRKEELADLKSRVLNGSLSPTEAVEMLFSP
ncbi:methylmalonyl Co-A mutase-associated GTPase MeaB [Jeotgalibacillus sp. S-D1]|uniref:methylmalonyl Co-A mutase-associated GTPase MeaB n=1 Tax=Jeotgalibacillus sp. S-D1 TaxID=2552189 RepID=UPI001F10523E|nr:methylmalonyl Co-A mutase-associated GTPase MeaB [Jeotgalibacillus sp. S-D1]